MKIGDIAKLTTRAVAPQNELSYLLYSLPAFDDGQMYDVLDGEEIQSNKYVVPDKCILFNKLNVRFKRIVCVENKSAYKLCSTEFLPLVVNEKIADYRYFYYLLLTDGITNYLCGQNTNTSGSHKRIDPNNFLGIDVNLPELSEQKHIADFLYSIDRKIELNKAINHNLPTPVRSSTAATTRLVA